MKRNLLILIAVFITMSQASSLTLATTHSISGPVAIAIKKYKVGNYTGCLQDTQLIVKQDPSNSVAYYYMAMSYVKAGKKDEAVAAYGKVLGLGSNPVLLQYAATGKRCIETPDQCKPDEKNQPELTDVDKMVGSKYVDGLSDDARTQVEQKRLQMIKNEINTDEDINNYKFKKFTDYTKQHSQSNTDDKVANDDKKPSNDEIVAALKVLNKAGLNPYAQTNPVANDYAQMANPMMTAQNAESAQLSMLLGSGNQSNNNNNNMMNMIPFMLAQNKNGQNNAGNPYSPQLVQSMLMNSMLPDFNYNTNNDK